jgi:two-component sensor histidine kinase
MQKAKLLYLFLLYLWIPWMKAQSRVDLLRNLDPVFDVALDSLKNGNSRAALNLLVPVGIRFKSEQNIPMHCSALLVQGKVYFEMNKSDSAIILLNEVIDIAKEGNYDRIEAIAEEGLARIYMNTKQYGMAMQHYRRFSSWSLAHAKPKTQVETCLQLVQIYTRKLEPDSIIRYLRIGQSIADGRTFPVLKYKLFQMAGLVWNNLNRPDSALHYYRKNLALLDHSPAVDRKIVVYVCMAHVFLDNHNPQRARKYLLDAQRLLKSAESAFPKAMLRYYEGLTLIVEKKEKAAVPVLEQALSAYKKLPHPKRHRAMQARCLRSLAEAYHVLGENEKALENLRLSKSMNLMVFQRYNELQSELMEAAILSDQDAIQASDELLMENLVWAQKSSNLNYQMKLYETLAANERKKKNYAQAIAYLDKVKALEEKLDPILLASRLNNSETQLEVAEHQKSIGELKQLNHQKGLRLALTRWRSLWLLGGLLLLSLITFVIYRSKRRLSTEKRTLSAALQEKELLLREIHHRVKNNMQVISSLLNLQARSVQDPVALKVMREGRDRVRSMALIHQTLYQNNDFSSVETEDYFLKLAENLFHTYNIDQDRVQLIAQIEPLKFNVDIMISLGLILNELISNTLKYAFPDQQMGVVRISLSTNEDNVELKVEDNGVGFPANFVPDAARSIGFSLINAFTQKLGGSLQLANAETGARTSLIFPLKNAA